MNIINGIYSSAKIFTTNNPANAIDTHALRQIQMLCDNETSKNCKIRLMPDVHPGKAGTIGLTMTVGTKIMPNLTGIDIGCGMTLAVLKNKKIELQKLDALIAQKIPSGFSIRSKPHRFAEGFDFSRLYCCRHIQKAKGQLSLGSLGSGNHFIEVDKDANGCLYIVIHSGSRHLGKEVTEYYLKEGQKLLKAKGVECPYELTYLEDEWKDHYLKDVQVVQDFATLNREIILDELVKGMKWKVLDSYSCTHNYVDDTAETLTHFNAPLLRKGAISAKTGEPVIIPINMRDGIILGKGLGNDDWNCSAPHGSGRIMMREDIKSNFTLSAFKSEMKGIYSSCISKGTLDEAPFAYRNMEDIVEAIHDTVQIDKIIRPIFNYKAGATDGQNKMRRQTDTPVLNKNI